MTEDNVIEFPAARQPRLSGKRRASTEIQNRFLAGHGIGKDVFEHLARGVYSTVNVLRERLGEKDAHPQVARFACRE